MLGDQGLGYDLGALHLWPSAIVRSIRQSTFGSTDESGSTSWAFSRRVRDAGIAPSMGAVGSAYDNAMVESFWGRMQGELFNRRRRKTRVEIATAIHDYIELFHNPKRRHPALGMLRPAEYEELHNATGEAA